jgi:hypothetical protein
MPVTERFMTAHQKQDTLLTLPPRWPHFFSEDSWSSKCTPAAPDLIIAFISSKQLSGPPKPASASATIGAYQSRCGTGTKNLFRHL